MLQLQDPAASTAVALTLQPATAQTGCSQVGLLAQQEQRLV
jgi:hypothetical protein